MSPARKAAFTILLRVERESAYAIELLHSSLLEDLSVSDRNLANEIVMGVLRWRSLLDASFARLVTKSLHKLDLEVLVALRMGAYQLAFLDRTPGHAVVHETVELVKQARKRSAASLVNAVMRKLAPLRAQMISTDKESAHDFAHPPWLVERWIVAFGMEVAAKVCRYDQQAPPTVIRMSGNADEEQLRAEGIELAPGGLIKNARMVMAGDVTKSKLLQSGRVAIQDEGSQLVAALVGEGKRMLDCCAAPGGKTAALAAAFPESEILATELHLHRARLLRRMAPQHNVHVIAADARYLPLRDGFDRVLADVPCSGTGTLARNPEIKWRLKSQDILDLQQRQISIVNSTLKHVAPGGRLIYSTCSLEREEGEQVIDTVLRENQEFEIVPVQQELARLRDSGVLNWAEIERLASGSFLRTFPGVHPCDGFFAAILRRTTKDTKGLNPNHRGHGGTQRKSNEVTKICETTKNLDAI